MNVCRNFENKKVFFCAKSKLSNSRWLTIRIAGLIIFFAAAAEINAEVENNKVIPLEKIIVTPQKRLVEKERLTESVFVIDSSDIKKLPVSSVEEVLEYAQSVDVRRRGVSGIQADLSIRGSNFEQVAVLVDGIKINDPQTAHHNMDLPLSLNMVDRIEVVRGGNSSLYGANAFGGIINVITKRPRERGVKLGTTRGVHNTSSQFVMVDTAFSKVESLLSFERKESSGYRPDTDFDKYDFYLNALLDLEYLPCSLRAGHSKKDFGASSFYSNSYPHEEEHTDTRFFALETTVDSGTLRVKPSVFHRRHEDKFILDRNRPWWYVNFHTTYVYGTEIQAEADLERNFFLFGLELKKEKITSTTLNRHSRDNTALFFLWQPKLDEKYIFNAGLRGDYFKDWGWQNSPSISCGYFLTKSLKLRGSIGRFFRIPSFTELYYDSPGNKGNANLVPEEGWGYETGFDYTKDKLEFKTTCFLRKEENIIDWARDNSTLPWQCRNINSLDNQGLETELILKPDFLREFFFMSSLSFGYSYLYTSHTQLANLTKYSPDYLRHQAHAGTCLNLPFNITQSLNFSYEERVNKRQYFILDSKISQKSEYEKFNKEFFISAANLLNTSCEEIAGLPMPGRWIEAGISFEF